MKISIIGCGHMGGAIAKALIAKKIGTVYVASPHKPKFQVSWTTDNKKIAQGADVIIIAVKPGIVMSVLQEIAPTLTANQLLMSVAAGIPLKKLARWSRGHKKIVRVLPNLPAQVFEGVSLWKSALKLTKNDKTIVSQLLNAFGKAIEVRSENLIDSGCAVSGCGPAFCAAFMETLAAFAKKSGFSPLQAREMALNMAIGSLSYMQQTGVEFGVLAKAVQTKGGVTEAAFKVLNKKKWQKSLEEALAAAYKRTREIAAE